MQILVVVAILCGSLIVSGCTDRAIDPAKKSDVKSEMNVHGGGAKESDSVGFREVIKKQTLPAYPAMSIGKAFDDYSHFAKKEWKETQGANGTMYIDFTGWMHGNPLSINQIKNGVSQQGVEIKFVIKREGAFFVGMVSKLEAKTDGKVYAEALVDGKAVLDSMYANKKIKF